MFITSCKDDLKSNVFEKTCFKDFLLMLVWYRHLMLSFLVNRQHNNLLTLLQILLLFFYAPFDIVCVLDVA